MSLLRAVRFALGASATTSVAILVWVVADGPRAVDGPVLSVGSTAATLGLSVDLIAAVLLVLVTGVGAVSAAFAARNLLGGARLARYAALHAATVAGLALAVTAASLPLLVVGWTLAGLALAGLVSHSGTAEVRRVAAAVRIRLLAGDLLLALGVVVAGTALSSLDRVDLAAATEAATTGADAVLVVLATVLMVLGASVRSALVPWHRWLPETAEGPTSTSALLHAGLVNGVGLLGVLAWPLVAASWPALVLLVVLGATSAVVATLLGRVRPDVKGRLATSTSAQMGYLALQVGLAVPAAALFHLIGHALYKATLFLGAGSTVAQSRLAAPAVPGRVVTGAAVLVAGAVTAAVAVPLLVAWPEANKGVSLVVPFALATVVAGIAMARLIADPATPILGRLLSAGAVLGVLVGFVVAALAWMDAFADTFAAPVALDTAALAMLVVAVVLAGLIGVGLDWAVRRGRLPWLPVRAALQSAPLMRPLPRRVGSVETGEFHEPTQADIARTRAVMDVAADCVGPTWPLTAYVAANPVAGLERLSYVEALAAASSVWGDRRDIGDAVFRRYYAHGRITDADLDAVIGERPDSADVRALLLADPDAGAHLHAAASEAVAGRTGEGLPRSGAHTWHGETAVEALDELLGARVTAWVDAQAAVWSAVVHGPPSAWGSGHDTLYAAWRAALTTGAADGPLGVQGAGELVAGLPERSDAAVATLLDRLDVPHRQRIGYLSRTLARMPGWAAHQAWRAAHDPRHDIADLLAVRLGLEFVLVSAATSASFGRPARWQELVTMLDERHDWDADGAPALHAGPQADAADLLAWAAGAVGWDERRLAQAGPDEVDRLITIARAFPPHVRLEMWQSALERSFRHDLLDTLRPRSAGVASPRPAGPRAQVVTCIDVRSERLRRHLEDAPDIETLGYAGFFGVPFSLVDADGLTTAQCPVLISPSNSVHGASPSRPVAASAVRSTGRTFRAAQKQPLLPMVLAEATGWLLGAAATVRTVAPRLAKSLERHGTFRPPEALVLSGADGSVGFDDSERVYLAEASLRAMGLVEGFAPVVVLLGHAGDTTNNPYAAGYDCGACGGNGGLVNARVAAIILNDPQVRDGLRERGIDIPDSTVVVAGLHDTTRDVVSLLPELPLPEVPGHLLATLADDLDRAARATAAERLRHLPDVPARVAGGKDAGRDHAARRAADWAETRPEWGLAGNAALVVGPRELTRGLDLDGRVFLHSYRRESDPDGAALEVILTAPLVVGQWINSGYLFATLDPQRFGAGDKALHNPVGGIGVLRGAHGDLRLGLPFQGISAGSADPSGLPVHEPQRLAAVVAADREVVAGIIDRQPSVRRLLTGRWVSLYVFDAGTPDVWQWTSNGWHRVLTPPVASSSRILQEVSS